MLIRPYIKGDEIEICPNEYSRPKDDELSYCDEVLTACQDDGAPFLVAGISNSDPELLHGFFLIGDRLGFKEARFVKNNMAKHFHNRPQKAIMTISVDVAIINKWHRFLGMTDLDCPVEINGTLCKSWVMTWA